MGGAQYIYHCVFKTLYIPCDNIVIIDIDVDFMILHDIWLTCISNVSLCNGESVGLAVYQIISTNHLLYTKIFIHPVLVHTYMHIEAT